MCCSSYYNVYTCISYEDVCIYTKYTYIYILVYINVHIVHTECFRTITRNELQHVPKHLSESNLFQQPTQHLVLFVIQLGVHFLYILPCSMRCVWNRLLMCLQSLCLHHFVPHLKVRNDAVVVGRIVDSLKNSVLAQQTTSMRKPVTLI